jgi:putative ABC transport system ATP-binding protein
MERRNGDQVDNYAIELRDVYKSFKVGDEELPVLKGINATIEPGEFVSIVGPSGNGKSTLLNMITGIDRPTQGQIFVDGQAVHTMSENQLAKWRGRQVGVIFQFFQMLPSLSLLQNVVLPMEFLGTDTLKARRERALHLLEMVGLADQAQKLPGMVSGGQQQRAAIARALANDPPLLVADEPTGNLDSETAGQVFDIFHDLVEKEGKTVLMVTHDAHLADLIPRQINIVDGRVVDDHRHRGATLSLPPLSTEGTPLLADFGGQLSPVAA